MEDHRSGEPEDLLIPDPFGNDLKEYFLVDVKKEAPDVQVQEIGPVGSVSADLSCEGLKPLYRPVGSLFPCDRHRSHK